MINRRLAGIRTSWACVASSHKSSADKQSLVVCQILNDEASSQRSVHAVRVMSTVKQVEQMANVVTPLQSGPQSMFEVTGMKTKLSHHCISRILAWQRTERGKEGNQRLNTDKNVPLVHHPSSWFGKGAEQCGKGQTTTRY